MMGRPAAMGLLNKPRRSPIEIAMVRTLRDRLPALLLIMTLALALIGEGFAPAAMAMQPQSAAINTMSSSHLCADCAGLDHSKAVPAGCASSVCAGIVAVLPGTVLLLQASVPSLFPNVANSETRGISVPPPVGPPRIFYLA
jgi:hypothetical protein